jgi:hypothetical protein
MVANITLKSPPVGRGAPIAWDNVLYDSPSLGYVVATHQSLRTVQREVVLTYYLPLCETDPTAVRKEMKGMAHASWTKLILDDIRRAHPDIESEIPDWAWILLIVGIDVAHVYSSIHRTYVDPHELSRRPILYPWRRFSAGPLGRSSIHSGL